MGVPSGDGKKLDAFVGDAVFGDGLLGAGACAGAGAGIGFGTKFNVGTGLFVGSTTPPPCDEVKDINPESAMMDPTPGVYDSLLKGGDAPSCKLPFCPSSWGTYNPVLLSTQQA